MEEIRPDKLHEMFMKQIALQEKLGVSKNIVGNQEYINVQSLALIDEVMEALRETPWKSWKTKQNFNQDKFKDELIDAWHFLINLSLASGMTSLEVYRRYLEKNKINHKRKEEGY